MPVPEDITNSSIKHLSTWCVTQPSRSSPRLPGAPWEKKKIGRDNVENHVPDFFFFFFCNTQLTCLGRAARGYSPVSTCRAWFPWYPPRAAALLCCARAGDPLCVLLAWSVGHFVVHDYRKLFGKTLPSNDDRIDSILDDVSSLEKAARCFSSGFFFLLFFSTHTCARAFLRRLKLLGKNKPTLLFSQIIVVNNTKQAIK